MSPWISIAVSVATAVIAGLVGFIVKRELSRQTDALKAIRVAHETEVKERREALAVLTADLRSLDDTCETKYLSKELFNRLEEARKEVDQLRREQDGRLEGLIKDLLSTYGGGQGGA
jgi:type II secretory pathway pseudopilin PulG